MILSFGPFALPLLILSPAFSKKSKLLISLLILIITYYITSITINMAQTIQDPEKLENFLKTVMGPEERKTFHELLRIFGLQ